MTITDITIAATKDNDFVIDYTLGDYEGEACFHSESAVRVLVEDTIDLEVPREFRTEIADAVHRFLLDGCELITLEVFHGTDGNAFECDIYAMLNGVTHSTLFLSI